MTLSDLFKWDFSYSSAVVIKISTDSALRVLIAIAEILIVYCI